MPQTSASLRSVTDAAVDAMLAEMTDDQIGAMSEAEMLARAEAIADQIVGPR